MPGCIRRFRASLVAALALAARCAPRPRGAKIIEIGETAPRPRRAARRPRAWPSRARPATRSKVGDSAARSSSRRRRIVAWTIALGSPDERADRLLRREPRRPGVARASPILRPGKHAVRAASIGQSAVCRSSSRYFGRRSSSRSTTSIPVKKGYVVALTVPTWAPGADAAGSSDGARGARAGPKGKCNDTDGQTAQTTDRRSSTQYRCLYRRRG